MVILYSGDSNSSIDEQSSLLNGRFAKIE